MRVDDDLAAAVAHVRENAARYLGLPSSSPTDVRVAGEGRRPRANIVRIELAGGGTRLPLIVKQTSLPSSPEAVAGREERPRLVVRQDYKERHRFEYLGLVAAEDYFGRLGDPRFGSVRVFDHLPDSRAFVVEEVTEPTLRDRLAGPGRLTPAGRRALERGFRNAGAWLRHYQALPAHDPVPLRGTVADVLAAVRDLAAFLARVTDDREYFARVTLATERAAAAGAVTDPLEIGLWHGDFAPRNVFASADGRVAGFDMAARRRVPVLEDVAYFCMSLRAGTLRLATRWLDPRSPRAGRYERLFLSGYFGDEPVPERAVRLFMVLATLDNWARVATEAPRTGAAARARRAAADRSLRRETTYLIDSLM